MKTLITKELLDGAMNYTSYRDLIQTLLQENKTTGNDHSESLVDYTKMNVQRMNRWDKTAVLLESSIKKINELKSKTTWLVITEGWCGDASQILPIINKMEECSPNICVKYILRDEHHEIMNRFLTNGAKAIPIVVFIDSESLAVIGHWGPRPSEPQKIVLDFKKNPNGIKEQLYATIHAWYAKNKGVAIQEELINRLEKVIQ